MSRKRKNSIYSYFFLLIFISAQISIATHHHKAYTFCKLTTSSKEKHLHEQHTHIETCSLCAYVIKHNALLSHHADINLYVNNELLQFKYLHTVDREYRSQLGSRAPPSEMKS